jgi:hypothetical protein
VVLPTTLLVVRTTALAVANGPVALDGDARVQEVRLR